MLIEARWRSSVAETVVVDGASLAPEEQYSDGEARRWKQRMCRKMTCESSIAPVTADTRVECSRHVRAELPSQSMHMTHPEERLAMRLRGHGLVPAELLLA